MKWDVASSSTGRPEDKTAQWPAYRFDRDHGKSTGQGRARPGQGQASRSVRAEGVDGGCPWMGLGSAEVWCGAMLRNMEHGEPKRARTRRGSQVSPGHRGAWETRQGGSQAELGLPGLRRVAWVCVCLARRDEALPSGTLPPPARWLWWGRMPCPWRRGGREREGRACHGVTLDAVPFRSVALLMEREHKPEVIWSVGRCGVQSRWSSGRPGQGMVSAVHYRKAWHGMQW